MKQLVELPFEFNGLCYRVSRAIFLSVQLSRGIDRGVAFHNHQTSSGVTFPQFVAILEGLGDGVAIDDRVQLMLSVDNMNTSVSGRESLNGVAEPGRDLLEIDVFDGTKSVRAKNRCNVSRLETADRTFINFLKLFGPLRF
jgi:hypothetical protein